MEEFKDDFYSKLLEDNRHRNKLEAKLDEYNHIMELVRTVLPIIMIILQVIILIKII